MFRRVDTDGMEDIMKKRVAKKVLKNATKLRYKKSTLEKALRKFKSKSFEDIKNAAMKKIIEENT